MGEAQAVVPERDGARAGERRQCVVYHPQHHGEEEGAAAIPRRAPGRVPWEVTKRTTDGDSIARGEIVSAQRVYNLLRHVSMHVRTTVCDSSFRNLSVEAKVSSGRRWKPSSSPRRPPHEAFRTRSPANHIRAVVQTVATERTLRRTRSRRISTPPIVRSNKDGCSRHHLRLPQGRRRRAHAPHRGPP